jgi:hypothetical protein
MRSISCASRRGRKKLVPPKAHRGGDALIGGHVESIPVADPLPGFQHLGRQRDQRQPAVHAQRAARVQAMTDMQQEEFVELGRDRIGHAQLGAGKRVMRCGVETVDVLRRQRHPALRFGECVVDEVTDVVVEQRHRRDPGLRVEHRRYGRTGAAAQCLAMKSAWPGIAWAARSSTALVLPTKSTISSWVSVSTIG